MIIPLFLMRKSLILTVLALAFLTVKAQRTYKPASVLATGNWFRIAVASEGVYKMDLAFLNSLGITGTIPSPQIRLFGTGGGMLPEANATPRIDDLQEVAISVEDGGDGVLNGQDFILFYAQGPHHWVKDSVNRSFIHKKNLYSEKAYYFLTIGNTGKRVQLDAGTLLPSATVTSFDERFFHELDSVNFLSSGKEWFGEEFSNGPGKTLIRSFALPGHGILPGTQATLVLSVASRSVNNPGSFSLAVNGQQVQQIPIGAVGTGVYDAFARQAEERNVFAIPLSPVLTISYTPGSFNSQGWLNWFRLFHRRQLSIPGNGQLLFRDWNTVNTPAVEFLILGADPSARVWDVTDPFNPVQMNTSVSGNMLRFVNDAMVLREYACTGPAFLQPEGAGMIAQQNLHAASEADYLIVTPPVFLQQAQRLAAYHQQRNQLKTVIVTTEQVFNEFGGGAPDPSAIRDFAKMYYDKYRANWSQSGKYLLLFGKASYDYKDRIVGHTNLVPAYESEASLDPLATYTSDDFFGFLDDQEDINSGLLANNLDIGIGRVPAKNIDEAKNFVDKVLAYHTPASLGPWRNQLNFIADDEDFNLHLQDAEILTATVSATAPVFNGQKIYLDAFQQEGGSSGGRYPQANNLINNQIHSGTLIWNYNGHGGAPRLAEEVILDQSIVNQWSNENRLPLFITATCDFAPFDHPLVHSLGENLIVRPKTGAIALMTTTRVVFANSNRIINNNYLKIAFEPDAAGRYKTLGEAVMATKNFTYQTSGDLINNRKFALLGDPAMTLGFPTFRVDLTKVNGVDIAIQPDTLSATETIVMEGEIRDLSGNLQNDFTGTAYLSVFDKIRSITTLANDPASLPQTFQDQTSLLFRGKATAENGRFVIRFRLPKDINYQYGTGKISLYAEDGTREGNGFNSTILVGGIAAGGNSDQEGPEIKAYLNDERFVNGGIANNTPILILKLFDSSGINTGGSGIGHDIVATLDNDNNSYYVLNNFYESDLDDYQKGTLRFQLPRLEAGPHSLKIKVWDVMNNSAEVVLDFIVVESDILEIKRVLNYPNPFTTSTAFWFEHNQPGMDLYARVEIFTVSGKLIKILSQTINTPGNRSNEILWDGRDEYGNKVGRGVYIYRLRIRTFSGKAADKWERLVIL